MALLKFVIFTLTLLVQGGSSQESIDVFYHPGQDATLPCEGPSTSQPQDCPRISWLHCRNSSKTIREVKEGNIMSQSGRGARLTLNPDCSLVIRSITVEDVGLYACRRGKDDSYDVNVYLNILRVRLDPAVSEGRTDGEVKLECTLFRYEGLPGCRFNGLRWLDDSGFELTEGVQKFSRGADCLSDLTVKLENGSSRRFICQFVNRANKVEIQAELTAGLKAVNSQLNSIIVREGENVTLPSGFGITDQSTCDGVDWLKGSTDPKNVVHRGQVKSERVTLTTNCSLVLKTVSSQDAAIYHFQLVDSGQDIQFYLSVLQMSYREEQGVVTLTCSAPAHHSYRHMVKWVYEGAGKPGTGVTEKAPHSNSVSFPTASVKPSSAYLDLYKCEVTDGYTRVKRLFGFRSQPTIQEPGDDENRTPTTETTMKPTTTTERGGLTKTNSTLKDWWFVFVAAGVSVVVIIIIVLIIRWRRSTGRKTKSTDSTELSLNPTAPPQVAPETNPDMDPETEVSYAAVSYTKRKGGVKAQNTPDDSDSVMYSTLKASSPSAAADPSSIYATVRKTTHTTESSS
ncbi:uncharacterized protein LOC141801624 [Halichoeres trimaculatus]|uniref:uncharacterized protein LOC141801624 n=1 Tax=Halichoeres trimaculatus TaxID=147232 RepID=UPI003D9EEC42